MRVYPLTRASRKGKLGLPHVRHDYSILRRERAKGCVIQVAKAGADFVRAQLRGMAECGRERVRLSASLRGWLAFTENFPNERLQTGVLERLAKQE